MILVQAEYFPRFQVGLYFTPKIEGIFEEHHVGFNKVDSLEVSLSRHIFRSVLDFQVCLCDTKIQITDYNDCCVLCHPTVRLNDMGSNFVSKPAWQTSQMNFAFEICKGPIRGFGRRLEKELGAILGMPNRKVLLSIESAPLRTSTTISQLVLNSWNGPC